MKMSAVLIMACFVVSAMMIGFSSDAHAKKMTPEEKQLKTDKRNLSSLEKQVDYIQQCLDAGTPGKAKSAVKRAGGFYDKLSADFQKSNEAVALKKKLDQLSAEREKQETLEDNKEVLGNMGKKIDEIQKYLDMDSLVSARKNVENAERYFQKLTPDFQNSPDALVMKKRLNDMDKVVAQKEKDLEASIANTNAILEEKGRYGSIIRPYLEVYYILDAGKVKDVSRYSLRDIEKIENQLQAFKDFEPKLRESIPTVIAQSPGHTYEGASVEGVLDAFKNADAYRADFIKAVHAQSLDKLIEDMSDRAASYKAGKIIGDSMMEELYGERAKRNFNLFDDIEQSSKATGFPLPQDKVKKLVDFKPMMRSSLESVAEKNSWKAEKKSKYSYRSGRLEDVLENEIEKDKKGMELVEYGTLPEIDWMIKKNALGIPLYKTSNSYALLKKKGEPFYRCYHFTFVSNYNGGGYEPISSVSIQDYSVPYKK